MADRRAAFSFAAGVALGKNAVLEGIATVFEPVKDHRGAAAEEHELTPIFHALTSHHSDPAEQFRRDPLAAPLPGLGSLAPAVNRMMLHPVPNSRPESNFRRPAHAAEIDAESRQALSIPADRVKRQDRADEPATIVLGRLPRHSLHDRDSAASTRRSGRHRVLRAVDRSSGPGRGGR
jgi:hypothetical protein